MTMSFIAVDFLGNGEQMEENAEYAETHGTAKRWVLTPKFNLILEHARANKTLLV